MNFERYQCQEFIEAELGCASPELLSQFKAQIDDYKLPQEKVNTLNSASVNDSVDIFYKSSVTFLEALFGMKRNHSSWSIVKLYYSIFYSLRAYLLVNGYAPFKNGKGGIYFIKVENGARLIKKSTKNVKGDHKVTIKAFSDFFDGHKLNTNKIDEGTIFDWAMSCRELVNYRNASFIEPDYGYEAMPTIGTSCNDIDSLLKQYISSPYYSYCFDKKNSLLSTAIVLLHELVVLYRSKGVKFLSLERSKVLKQVIKKAGLSSSQLVNDIFCVSSDVFYNE